MKDGKFDEKGDKKRIQEMEFSQSQPVANSIPVNELGDTLIVRVFGDLGLSEKFAKEVFLYLKNKKTNNKFRDFDDFERNYLEKIVGTKTESSNDFHAFMMLDINRQINF